MHALIVRACKSSISRLLVGPFTGGLMVDYISFEWSAAVFGLFIFLTVIYSFFICYGFYIVLIWS